MEFEFVAGFVAAVAAPALLSVGFFIWEGLWEGSAHALNMYKCALATVVFLGVIGVSSAVGSRSAFGGGSTAADAGFLILSAVIGIVIGDNLWLQALKTLGARRVITIDVLKPFCAAFLGAVTLGEKVTFQSMLATLLTMFGVLIVSLEKKEEEEEEEKEVEEEENKGTDLEMENIATVTKGGEARDQGLELSSGSEQKSRNFSIGYVLAAVNVIVDVYGSVLTKQYGLNMTTFEINAVRFGSAAVILFLCTIAVKGLGKCSVLQETAWSWMPQGMPARRWGLTSAGVFLVTFGCPALRNYALFQLPIREVLTLTSLGPIFALPISCVAKRKRPSRQACIGALCSVAGVILFFYT
eukprot:g2972.t1